MDEHSGIFAAQQIYAWREAFLIEVAPCGIKHARRFHNTVSSLRKVFGNDKHRTGSLVAR
jgi:hypothetical protein